MLNRLSAVLLASCLALPVLWLYLQVQKARSGRRSSISIPAAAQDRTTVSGRNASSVQSADGRRARSRENEESFNFLDRTRGFFSRSGDYFDRQVRYRNAQTVSRTGKAVG